MGCADTTAEFLWNTCFSDPPHLSVSQYLRGPCNSKFRQKQEKERLSMYSHHNSLWFSEEALQSETKHGYFAFKAGDKFKELQVPEEFQDRRVIFNLIKTCGKEDFCKATRIHAKVRNTGLLEKDIYVGTALIHMFGKCGMLANAQEVFDELPARDTTSWNALIAGYVQHGLGNEGLDRFEHMQDEGFCPDAVTFVCILKACGSKRAGERGEKIHANVIRHGLLEENMMVGTALVDMYAKCGMFAKAWEVLEDLPAWDASSWTALIAGFAERELGHEALDCFGRMRQVNVLPDLVTFVSILKSCGSIGAIREGEEVHAEVSKQGLLEKHTVLSNALVDMYAKCGALAKAQKVFAEFAAKNVATWTSLLAGYAQNGCGNEAINCFEQMQEDGTSPNAITYACLLKACGDIGAIGKGKEIHFEISRKRLLDKDIVLGNALVDMYAKCGDFAKARKVFDQLPLRDVGSWNVLMTGYTQHGLFTEVLDCLGQMEDEGLSPDAITFVCVLKACGRIGALEKGEKIHLEIDRQGLLDKNISLGNALMEMYVNCGMIAKAQEVFDELPAHHVMSWNLLIAGYMQQGMGNEALHCFERGRAQGILPDAVTFIAVLKACSSIGALEKGEEFHCDICSQGLLETNGMLGTVLVDMYAKCGALVNAQAVFAGLTTHDVASWTTLIAGYARHGLDDEALDCLLQMQKEGLCPNVVTFVCILNSCACMGAVEKGEEIHAIIKKQGLLQDSTVLGNALVDMYAKCGVHEKAQKVFDELLVRDIVSWTCLIAGYAHLGMDGRVFSLFSTMIGECIEPDIVTFAVLLTACSHAGLVEKAQICFHTIHTIYCLIPSLEHYICTVDLLSRSGQFDKAISVIGKAPFSKSDCFQLWSALLGSCGKWATLERARWAFEHAVQLDESYSASYVCMSNMYAAAGLQEEEARLKV